MVIEKISEVIIRELLSLFKLNKVQQYFFSTGTEFKMLVQKCCPRTQKNTLTSILIHYLFNIKQTELTYVKFQPVGNI